jgi:hypothetical protein
LDLGKGSIFWGGEGGGAVEESIIYFFWGGEGFYLLPAGNYIPNINVIIFKFQLNLIPSTYSVIVLSSFGILRWEFDFLSFFISIAIALIA